MQEIHGLELPPRKIQYLVFLFRKGGRAKVGDLSGEFRVDPSTVTKTIADLGTRGYLSHRPYGEVELTEEGRRYARFLLRRHRILELLLSHFGFPPEDACREASHFEGYVSRDAVDRICASMGHPVMGVCGEISRDSGCCPEPE
ncbi:MAG: metal-dependent transcriptional regulator [Methanomicrobiales archaeon]|nr:metal-dependent transcriptional regulator [Methanomicrobiales archaeon]MDD1658215.1 metal-dependent transcriptional regulator [Methanomicrobiales archaeon]